MVGEAAALGSAAFWAVSAIIIKGASARLSAFYLMSIRTTFAAVLVLAVFLVTGADSSAFYLPPGTIAALLGSGVIAILGDVAFVRAMAVEDISKVFTVSTSLYIILSVAGSVLFAGDPFSVLLLVGGIAVLAGSRLVIHQPGDATTPAKDAKRQPILALQLAVIAAIFWTTSLLTLSSALDDVEPLSAAALRLPFMALSLCLIATVRGELRFGRAFSDLRTIAISGVFTSLAIMLFLLSAKLASAGTVAVLTSTSPIFVAPLAHFFLGERLTPRIAIGTTACMVGIWLASV